MQASAAGRGHPRAGSTSKTKEPEPQPEVPLRNGNHHGMDLPTMFEHMFRRRPSMADLRRRTLTLIDVIAEQHTQGPLVVRRILLAAALAAVLVNYMLPRFLFFGYDRWLAQAAVGHAQPRPGGFFAEVSWAYALMLSVGYISLVFLGVRHMERRPPLQRYVFEAMAVYNCLQSLLNLINCFAILIEVRRLGYHLWGNAADSSPEGHTLGSLIWLQYHIRQLQLVETFFMVLRKKFQRISLLHLYLHVLNLWGWYFACRFACGGDAYFPAVITSGCQAMVYLYYSLSLLGLQGIPCFKKALITEVQILQYLLCAVYNIFTAARGQLPPSLAALHLFVIANGLVLYTDFHYEGDFGDLSAESAEPKDGGSTDARVTFSFDSSGWLYCYHFGVALYIQEHLLPGVTREGVAQGEFPKGIAFSGSSGGALVSAALATGTDVLSLFNFVLEQHATCREDPRRMFPAVEKALRRYDYPGLYKSISGRLRVLLTRVSWRPPFVMGEVVDRFADNESCIAVLVASCHAPLVAGILPKKVGNCYYYDGMMWTATLVPWRCAWGDRVVKVSARGAPLHDIQSPAVPFWWMIVPPSVDVLRGMFWCGYRDAALWFSAPPPLLSLACSCRRAPGPSKDNGERAENAAHAGKHGAAVDDALKTWQAARALLRQQPVAVGQELPAKDPTTGQDVHALVAQFRAAVDRENYRVRLLAAAILPVAVAMTWNSILL